jgi:hypothetical protein
MPSLAFDPSGSTKSAERNKVSACHELQKRNLGFAEGPILLRRSPSRISIEILLKIIYGDTNRSDFLIS